MPMDLACTETIKRFNQAVNTRMEKYFGCQQITPTISFGHKQIISSQTTYPSRILVHLQEVDNDIQWENNLIRY